MIFSLSNQSFQKINFEMINTDIFCFFHSENAVIIPVDIWFHAVVTSLKLKKDVLILEGNISVPPSINSQRWLIGDEFLWLAPRSNSVLFEAVNSTSGTYTAVKAFLTCYK
jgi:hypothetical protein